MPSDLHRVIQDSGPDRVTGVDLHEIARRARRWRVQRVVLAATTALAVAAAGAGAWAALPEMMGDPTPVGPAGNPCPAPDHDIAIYLREDVTQAEIVRLQKLLSKDERVETVAFFSKTAAYEEFKDLYRDEPEFWENLPKDALPASIRVRLVPGTTSDQIETVASTSEGAPGVDEVLTAGEAEDRAAGTCAPPDRALRDRRDLGRHVRRIEAALERLHARLRRHAERATGRPQVERRTETLEEKIEDLRRQRAEAIRDALNEDGR